jgi:C-terminal processing protease CtpA/Prc
MKSALLGLCAVTVALITGVTITKQQRQITQLRAWGASLEQQALTFRAALETMSESDEPAQADAARSQLGGADKRELLRLRNEVSQLRAERARAQGLEEENARLKSQMNSMNVVLGTMRVFNADGTTLQPSAPLPPRNAWIGVAVSAGPQGTGVLVSGVMTNSPAAEAQLREGDILLSIDGAEVTSPEYVRNTLAARQPGQVAVLDIVRDGQAQQVYIVPATPPVELRQR